MEQNDDGGGNRRRTGKVERLIEEYRLAGVGDELERRWTGETSDQRSLRQLAEEFNQRLLRAAMDEAGITALDGDIQNLYRLLTTDEAGGRNRTQARRRLERAGVDLDRLHADFVSHEAVRTYMKHRGATKAPRDAEQITKELQHIQRLQSRLRAVTDSKLDQLRATDRLSLGDARVLVDVHVFCEDCETQFDVNELLARRSCACG